MATGNTNDGLLNLPYPTASDPVNVHGDIEALVDRLKIVLPPLGLSYFEIRVQNTSGSNISAGTPVYATGYSTKTTIAKSLPETNSPILGLTKTDISNGSDGVVIVAGVVENINTSSFNNGDVLYVASGGGLTNIRPETGSKAVGVVAHAASASSNGIIIIEATGNGTWGALKNGLS